MIKSGGVFTNHFLRCIHNLAQGLGWLPWPIIPPKLWPQAEKREKRGVTLEEHEKVIASEQNSEKTAFYELLWEIGTAQSDAANLQAENIDWKTLTLSFRRMKTDEWCHLSIGPRLEVLLRSLPQSGFLFPTLAPQDPSWRAAEFSRRCRLLKIKRVTLHSYRHSWAARAKDSGMPERFAMEALGHNSRAVHEFYAHGERSKCPPWRNTNPRLSRCRRAKLDERMNSPRRQSSHRGKQIRRRCERKTGSRSRSRSVTERLELVLLGLGVLALPSPCHRLGRSISDYWPSQGHQPWRTICARLEQDRPGASTVSPASRRQARVGGSREDNPPAPWSADQAAADSSSTPQWTHMRNSSLTSADLQVWLAVENQGRLSNERPWSISVCRQDCVGDRQIKRAGRFRKLRRPLFLVAPQSVV